MAMHIHLLVADSGKTYRWGGSFLRNIAPSHSIGVAYSRRIGALRSIGANPWIDVFQHSLLDCGRGDNQRRAGHAACDSFHLDARLHGGLRCPSREGNGEDVVRLPGIAMRLRLQHPDALRLAARAMEIRRIGLLPGRISFAPAVADTGQTDIVAAPFRGARKVAGSNGVRAGRARA